MHKDDQNGLMPEDVAYFFRKDDLRESEETMAICDLYKNHRDMIARQFRDDRRLFQKQVDHLLILWKLPPDEKGKASRMMTELRNTTIPSKGAPAEETGKEQKLAWLRQHYSRFREQKILFCNIAYMSCYEGDTGNDIPVGAGKWVAEHRDGHEKWNFLNYGGLCYGFVQNKGRFRLENFEGISSQADRTDGVTIVWCAPKAKDETVIVGWYENAVVYRDYRNCICTAATGLDRCYFCCADADDCYLLPEQDRIFKVQRAARAGTGKGFGQQNYWYAKSEYARKDLIPKALAFMDSHRKNRINRTNVFFRQLENLSGRLLKVEEKELERYIKEPDFMKIFPLAIRKYKQTGCADDAYYIALCYQEFYQFKEAVKWLETVKEIEGESWDTAFRFPYWYQQIEEYEKSIHYAQKALKFPEAKERDILDDMYCLMADNHYNLGNMDEAVKYLNLIINESDNEELVDHVQKVKGLWLEK